MSRRRRLQTPELVRHVMARGNARMRIFLDDTDYRYFVYVLGEVMEESRIVCWNYCLMPNHYHLTVQPTLPNLSQSLQRLNGTYGYWWNKRHGRVGHVFQGRFKDQIVDREGYLRVLARYVVMNPVRAGLVRSPDDWNWSSYRATVGASITPSFLSVQRTLSLFSAEPGDGQTQFAAFVRNDADDQSAVDRLRSCERIVGSRAFKEHVETISACGV